MTDMKPTIGIWAAESDDFKRGLKAKGDMWKKSLKDGTFYHTLSDDKWYRVVDVTEEVKVQLARIEEEETKND